MNRLQHICVSKAYRLGYATQICRTISTASRVHPLIRDFTGKLAQSKPSYRAPPNRIRILHEPTQFLDTLIAMINRANDRIFISSLYIGSEETRLMSALEESLKTKPNLHVYLHLDLNRSTRPGPSSTANVLLPLLQRYPERLHVSFFRSPHLRGLMAKIVPPRFNEGWGTWHAKVYGVDNEVMISGANLNKSYFTNRQDRYLHFEESPSLAKYCFDFLKTVSPFTFRLLPEPPKDATSPHSYKKEGYYLSWQHSTHPHKIQKPVQTALAKLQQANVSAEVGPTSDEVLVFPLIQGGQFGIREEEETFGQLFRQLRRSERRPLLDLTSGYFSLYQPYQSMILSSPNVDCRIVAASPKANGFYGSAGLSGRIPEGYTLYEQRFIHAVKKAGRLWKAVPDSPIGGQGVLLSEWSKPGWTYHAKGIWLSPDSSSPPILTLFGSTNLNARSAHLDTELSFLMVLPSEGSDGQPSSISILRAGLQEEVSKIREHTTEWQGWKRKVRATTKMIVWLIRGML
ncbi:hypothetical protein D9611_001998 [Ephemerocybe angulata]|uniref:CDP-diacylglycerol--glycerol-3-phosphate 3-phosphatidyltransferase n=1 Tax=Ephemerocybe angulata TaxID=980116 RepID=A0A8H5FLY5_9AGAR|nr:hypothetical protein D9611_001998 [Tulosesus angulatus]